ncbi:hypothetical protein ACFLTH_08320 [Bacteroidota bacterium]
MKKPHIENEPPPIMKKWSRLYWLMIINLIGLLLFFYLFRKVFE